jgi:hypothetical protein
MAKRKRRKARHNPPASSYVGYALVGIGAYLLFRKWKGMGAATQEEADIAEAIGYISAYGGKGEYLARTLTQRGYSPETITTAYSRYRASKKQSVPAPTSAPATAERTPAVEAIALKQNPYAPTTPPLFPFVGTEMGAALSAAARAAAARELAYAASDEEQRNLTYGIKPSGPLVEDRAISSSPYAAFDAEQQALTYGIKPSGPPDAARAAIERVVGPMTEPAPMIPGSPTNYPGWWRNYTPPQLIDPGQLDPQTGNMRVAEAGQIDVNTRAVSLPAGDDTDSYAGRSSALITNDAARAVGDNTGALKLLDTRRTVAPQPKPKPLNMAQVKEVIAADTDREGGRYLQEAKGSGKFNNRFFEAIQSKGDGWSKSVSLTGEGAGGFFGKALKILRGEIDRKALTQTGISSAYYAQQAKVGDQYAREDFRNYQNAYIKLADLERQASAGQNVVGQLDAAKRVLDSYNMQANKSRQDKIETRELKEVQWAEPICQRPTGIGLCPISS